MRGTIYCYYNKVLVADCRLKTLEPYMGQIDRDSVVQLLVYPLGTDHAPLSAPVGISADGDFYLAAISKDMIYQIHKNGMLIRTYAANLSLVEETIMEVPMAVMAMLQGKILLRGTFLCVQDSAYIFLGDMEAWKPWGQIREGPVLIMESGEKYQAVGCSCAGYKATGFLSPPKSLALKGIYEIGKPQIGMMPIESLEEKKRVLLDNFVGIHLFPLDLKQKISESVGKICGDIPMAALGVQGMAWEEILKMLGS